MEFRGEIPGGEKCIMEFRKYLAGVTFVALLFWGPIDYSWPAWLAIRIGYIIVIPFLIWLILGWIWSRWELSPKVEYILTRVLAAMIFITLVVYAILEATSKTHVGNTKWIQTREGMEAVGDDIILTGPDWFNVLIFVAIAAFVFWFGVLDKGSKDKKL